MSTEEKINLLFEYVRIDVELYREICLKNDAVKKQDFATALIHREKEVELRKQYLEFGDKVLNSDLEVQASVATDDDSSNAADKQK